MTLAKIENRQKKHKPSKSKCVKLLEWLIHRAQRNCPKEEAPWSEVTVVLVNDKLSDAAHRATFNIIGATDVITLHYAAMPGFSTGDSGELIVNVDRAVNEGSKSHGQLGWSPSHELALYMAHGIDHLTGRDDLDPLGRRQMRSREMRWVRAADKLGLINGLI